MNWESGVEKSLEAFCTGRTSPPEDAISITYATPSGPAASIWVVAESSASSSSAVIGEERTKVQVIDGVNWPSISKSARIIPLLVDINITSPLGISSSIISLNTYPEGRLWSELLNISNSMMLMPNFVPAYNCSLASSVTSEMTSWCMIETVSSPCGEDEWGYS